MPRIRGYTETASYLGLKVGALRARVHRGTIPFRVKDRGPAARPVILFDLDELDAWNQGRRFGDEDLLRREQLAMERKAKEAE